MKTSLNLATDPSFANYSRSIFFLLFKFKNLIFISYKKLTQYLVKQSNKPYQKSLHPIENVLIKISFLQLYLKIDHTYDGFQ